MQFISIHTFLAEGDDDLIVASLGGEEFQSTPSSRKVTGKGAGIETGDEDFNPHLPRGR